MFSEQEDARKINGVIILGPGLFATDEAGQALSPIASAFPSYRTLVTGRGIHAMHSMVLADYLRRWILVEEHRTMTAEEEEAIYDDAVSLVVMDSTVLIRSDPSAMEKTFAADEMLKRLVPKHQIQFTGIHLPEVRKMLRRRGESWRITPPPRSVQEVAHYIHSSRAHVSTGALYYQNAHTGGRFLTYQDFMQIQSLMREDREEALSRLSEIIYLTRLVNDEGAKELTFFLPIDRALSAVPLKDIISALERAGSHEDQEEAENLFKRFAETFAVTAGPDLTGDDEDQDAWRTTMFCRLYNINEKEVEEWVLGLSPEFHLNVRWLPGARILEGGELMFEPTAEPHIRNLILHYWNTWTGLLSINIGRVESPQSTRDRTGQEREVYLVVLELPDGSEEIRLLRMMKWDVMHRLKLGKHRDQAIGETYQYRDYIVDRLRATVELGIPIPSYTEIRFSEELPGIGSIPVFFFDRRYVPGLATDKIPSSRYAQSGFIVRLCRLLGVAAAASITLGRACPRTGQVYFDDADEVVQFDSAGQPERIIISETTGSFTDWCMSTSEMLLQCLPHVARHLEKAKMQGAPASEISLAIEAFADSLSAEIARMQQLIQDPSSRLRSLFIDRSQEPGSIRSRWEGLLGRLESTDTKNLRQLIIEDPRFEHLRES